MRVLVTATDVQLRRFTRDSAKKYYNLEFVLTDYSELDITNSSKANDFFQRDSFDYSIMDKPKTKTILGTEIPDWTDSLRNCPIELKNR